MTKRTIEQIADALERRLSGTLPGVSAQLQMAPAHREALMRETKTPRNARDAAVLVAITDPEHPSLVLTERRPDLKHHPGQISFPGGRREPDEDLLATALRESEEEVGLTAADVTILGQLSSLYVPPSRYHVYPFVGIVYGSPGLAPASDEVSRIILADLDVLCDPRTRTTEVQRFGDRDVEIPFFDLGGDKIWGATAMMIAELVEALGT
jgi:8-oxo-dGTP pyrophosphatase MutT (NUDIX family)